MKLSKLELELLKITISHRLPAWAYRHLKDDSRQAFDDLISRGMVVLLSDTEYGATQEGREVAWDIEYADAAAPGDKTLAICPNCRSKHVGPRSCFACGYSWMPAPLAVGGAAHKPGNVPWNYLGMDPERDDQPQPVASAETAAKRVIVSTTAFSILKYLDYVNHGASFKVLCSITGLRNLSLNNSLRGLINRGLISSNSSNYFITPAGRDALAQRDAS